MKTSELIALLQEEVRKSGDLPTRSYLFPNNLKHKRHRGHVRGVSTYLNPFTGEKLIDIDCDEEKI